MTRMAKFLRQFTEALLIMSMIGLFMFAAAVLLETNPLW